MGESTAGSEVQTAVTRFLVVDDDTAILESMQALLELYELDMRPVHACDDVTDILDAERFDVVLHDAHMPGLDLDAQMERLRPYQAKGVKVVLFTGDEPSDAAQARYGVDDVLNKPFDPAELGALMDRLGLAHPDF